MTKVIPKIYKAYKKDRSVVYSLNEDWCLPTLNKPLHTYQSDLLSISDKRVIVHSYTSTDTHDICDGCSLSPDQCIIPTVVGALFHDVWYGELEEISFAWNMSLRDVRKIGDNIFGAILKALAKRQKSWWKRNVSFGVARIFYSAVRLFGGRFHKVNATKSRIAAAVIALGMLSGCEGCAAPDMFEDDSQLVIPQYEQSMRSDFDVGD